MNTDEYVALSPSTHAVPCSPFLRSYQEASPAPCVPDIDRIISRRLMYNVQESHGRTLSPLHFSQQSQNSQTDVTVPGTPSDHSSQKTSRKKISLEQVVPSCSPFVVTDEEKPAMYSQQQKIQEKVKSDTTNHKENIPLDQQISLFRSKEENKLVGSKRETRTMDHVTNVKPINFLKDDDIFD